MTFEIARSLLDRIVKLAAAEQDEVCGLLLGSATQIEAIMPGPNVAPDPARHFELDPAVLLAAHRRARAGGLAVVGHYHSHPSGVAAPSATDLACATPDGSLWLVVAGAQASLWSALPDAQGEVHFVPATLCVR